jgi:hypothetical protein
MKPSRWGVEHTFVDNSASRELSHEFDGALELRGRYLEVLTVPTYREQEFLVNVDIDNVWKAFPWDELLEVGRHYITLGLGLRGAVDFGNCPRTDT